jgi:hypothetical protein
LPLLITKVKYNISVQLLNITLKTGVKSQTVTGNALFQQRSEIFCGSSSLLFNLNFVKTGRGKRKEAEGGS